MFIVLFKNEIYFEIMLKYIERHAYRQKERHLDLIMNSLCVGMVLLDGVGVVLVVHSLAAQGKYPVPHGYHFVSEPGRLTI